jgi:hypothetical protein
MRMPMRVLGWTLGLLAVASCADSATGPQRQVPAAVRVSVDHVTLHSLGDTVQVVAQVLDTRGQLMPNVAVTWRAEQDGVVAPAGSAGAFQAAGNGAVRVWAELADATGQLQRGPGYLSQRPAAAVMVTVAQRPAQKSLTAAERTLWAAGATLRVVPAVADARGNPIAALRDPVRWASSDETVATVDTAGVVRALSDGTVQIRARVGEVEAAVTLGVSTAIGLEACAQYEGAEASACAAPLRLTVTARGTP